MRRSAVRELLKVAQQPGMISLAGGMPAPELFPVQEVGRCVEVILKREGAAALQYGPTEGINPLRDGLAEAFSRPGRVLSRENVVVTSGAQQALDLLGRVLLDEEDAVAVENPTYLAALMAWRPLGVRFVPLACDADGLRTAALDGQLQARPKLIYTIPNFQNPQGTTLALERRRQLLHWATTREVCLIEDNPYGDLRFEGAALPHLFHLSSEPVAEAGVVYVGTFSKVLAPGLRIGWVVGAAELIDKVVRAKQAADLHTSTLNQWIAVELTESLPERLPRLCAAYAERRDALMSALESWPEIRFHPPRGGLFLWGTLPAEIDTTRLLARALARGVAFVPGEEFHVEGGGRNTLRLSFATASPAELKDGVARLRQAVDDLGCSQPG